MVEKANEFIKGDIVWFVGSPGGSIKPGLYTYEGPTPEFNDFIGDEIVDNTEYSLISRRIDSRIHKLHLDGTTSNRPLGRKSTWSVSNNEIRVPTEAELILFGKVK